MFRTFNDDGMPPSDVLTMLSGPSNITAQTGVTQQDTADVANQVEASHQPPHPRLDGRNQEALQD